MSQENVELVLRSIEAFEHDEEALLSTFDPAIEWHQVWNEGDARTKLLLDLRGVTVLEDRVPRHAAVILRKVSALRRGLARPGDAGLRVDDHGSLEQPRSMERLERQERGRRIAAGIGHEPRPTNLRLMAFRQPVDRAVGKTGRRGVPPLAIHGVANTEGARQVDDAGPPIEQRGRKLRRASKKPV